MLMLSQWQSAATMAADLAGACAFVLDNLCGGAEVANASAHRRMCGTLHRAAAFPRPSPVLPALQLPITVRQICLNTLNRES